MKMVRHQRPGIAFTSGFLQASLKPGYELLPVSVIQKYIAPLYPARNNMIYCSGDLYAFMSWHGLKVSFLPLSCQGVCCRTRLGAKNTKITVMLYHILPGIHEKSLVPHDFCVRQQT